MALGIQNPFGFQSNITNKPSAGAAAPAAVQSAGSGGQTPALSPGSVISGQVLETGKDTALIRTADGQTIEARTEEGVTLSKGSYVSFEVSGASDSQISLKALFTNTAAGSSTMSAALSQAGIPETGASFTMVRSMMENGMPIDKASLQAMYRQVNAHPEALSSDLVDMTKLGLKLTDDTIGQFQAYRNIEHQISSAVEEVTTSLSETVDTLFSEGDTGKALAFIRDTAGVLTEDVQSEGKAGDAFLKLVDRAGDGKIPEGALEADAGGKVAAGAAKAQEAGAPSDPAAALLKALADAAGRSQSPDQASDATLLLKSAEGGAKGAQGSAGAEGKELAALAKDMDHGELLRSVSDGLKELLAAEKTPENAQRLARAAKLLQSEPFKEMLSEKLSQNWRMDPDTVSRKEQVQEFYEKMRSQTGKLAQVIEAAAGRDGKLFEQVTNINRNVDFMNQLNQTASYVQLPLRLSGEDAHGDLYVYTNKKNMAAADGKISAYLHLDMDHLGPVDVYVAMEHEKVSTNFYLADDEMIDFINENIHILNDRLADRGYDMSCKVSMKEDKKSGDVMEEILEDHRDGFLIGSKSFDVRA